MPSFFSAPYNFDQLLAKSVREDATKWLRNTLLKLLRSPEEQEGIIEKI